MIKKLPVFLLFLLFLCFPIYASADTINLQLYWSSPTGAITGLSGSYYLDYDAKINGSTSASEVFCVETTQSAPSWGVSTTYTLEALSGNYEDAAKVADLYYFQYSDDTDEEYYKAAAQLIIWSIINNDPIYASNRIELGSYLDAINYALEDYSSDTISNWVVATNSRYQDYLVRVPEPTQMLLFGTGLIALAGIGRKRFLKK